MFLSLFFFFNDTATTEIYTLSLHDALPISGWGAAGSVCPGRGGHGAGVVSGAGRKGRPHPFGSSHQCADRKSTRLNSSHANISYAVFCFKKKKKKVQRARCVVTKNDST